MYSLKRFVPEYDISGLYSYISDKPEQKKMPGLPIVRSKDEFADRLICQLQGFYHDLYLICEANQIKGYLLSFDYRVYDGHCRIFGSWDIEVNCEPLTQFIDFLCSEYPLRKIFLQVTKKENALMQSALNVGFTEEACLKEYKYADGQYVDMYVLSYYPGSDANGI
jgi:RimJ/RimL family protein N-acetyltransferase